MAYKIVLRPYHGKPCKNLAFDIKAKSRVDALQQYATKIGLTIYQFHKMNQTLWIPSQEGWLKAMKHD